MRKTMWFLVICLVVTSIPALAREDAPAVLLGKAIKAMGGAEAINAAPILAWTGTASVHVAEKVSEIRVVTEVNPNGDSLSRSWLVGQDASAARVLAITPRGGKLTRDGKTTAAPYAQWDHERIQFSIYQLIRLTPLLEPPTRLVRIAEPRANLQGFTVKRAGLPPAQLWFDDKRRLREIDLTVPDAETHEPVAEVVTLDGEIVAAGIRWPRILKIALNGKPYFDLELDTFSPHR
ncbi:MAG: hypothetical protein ABI411_00025 [Tahibacter sp.]